MAVINELGSSGIRQPQSTWHVYYRKTEGGRKFTERFKITDVKPSIWVDR
jgi:hypothetical protein